MSLSYRSPIEEILNRFTSEEQSKVSSVALNKVIEREGYEHNLFNFAMTDMCKEKLISAGIYLSPFSYNPHSHPVCKTLENHLLYTVVCPLLDPSFFFCSIKNSKISFLKSRNQSLSACEVVNRFVTAKDKIRYGSDFVVQNSINDPSFLKVGKAPFSDSLKDLLPAMIIKKPRSLFFHDELHYWSKDDLFKFLQVVEPDKILATIVVPPETLIGATKSLNPWCYEFEVVGKDLIFKPDNCASEAYIQPLGANFFLKTSTITLPNGLSYGVTLVSSKFSHHVVLISKGDYVPDKFRLFGNFEACSVGALNKISNECQPCFPMSVQQISKIYRYLRTLKKPDLQSAMAKLSQIMPNPTGRHIKFVEDFSELVISSDQIFLKYNSALRKRLLGLVFNCFPQSLAKLNSEFKEMSLDQFILGLESFEIRVKTQCLRLGLMEELYDYERSDFDNNILDPKASLFAWHRDWNSGMTIPERKEMPYSIYRQNQELVITLPSSVETSYTESFIGKHYNVLHDCNRNLLFIVTNYFINSFESNGFLPDMGELANILRIIIKKSKLNLAMRNCNFQYYFNSKQSTFKSWHLINSQRRRLIKFSLTYYGLNWFVIGKDFRYNNKYLQNKESKGLSTESLKQYFMVISDVKKGPVKLLSNSNSSAQRNQFREERNFIEESRVKQKERENEMNLVEVHLHPTFGVEINSQEDISPISALNAVELPMYIDSTISKELAREVSLHSEGMSIDKTWMISYAHISNHLCCSKESGEEKGVVDVLLASFDFTSFDGALVIQCASTLSMTSMDFKEDLYLDLEHYSLPDIFDYTEFILTSCYLQNSSDLLGEYEGRGIKFHKQGGMIGSLLNGEEFEKKKIKLKFDISAKISNTEDSFIFVILPFQIRSLEKFLNSDSLVRRKSIELGRAGFAVPLIAHSNECPKFKEFRINETRISFNWVSKKHGEILNDTSDNLIFGSIYMAAASFLDLNHNLFFSGLEGKMHKEPYSYLSSDLSSFLGTNMGSKKIFESIVVSISQKVNVYLSLRLPKEFSNDVENKEVLITVQTLGAEKGMDLIWDLETNSIILSIPKNSCVMKAISELLGRKTMDIYKVLQSEEDREFFSSIFDGQGVSIFQLENIFERFDISANVSAGGELIKMNENGKIIGHFKLEDGHISLQRASSSNSFSNSGSAIDCRKNVRFLDSVVSKVSYTPLFDKARNLAESFFEGETGVLLDKLFNKRNHLMQGWRQVRDRKLSILLGTFGCGKTTVLKKVVMDNCNRKVVYVSPRKALADQFRGDMIDIKCLSGKGKGKSTGRQEKFGLFIKTFETFLLSIKMVQNNSVVIFDEIQLYPPGYVDLILGLLSEEATLILAGDPCQSDYDSEKDRSRFSCYEADIFDVLKGKSYLYNIQSKRFRNPMYLKRLPCNLCEESLWKTEKPYTIWNNMSEFQGNEVEVDVVLCSSFDEKKIVQAYLGKVDCLTFGESTGLNFKCGAILITPDASLTSEKRWITALSRFSCNLHLINHTGMTNQGLLSMFVDRALFKFLTGQSDESFILDLLPGSPKLTKGFNVKIGSDEGVREQKLSGDPWLKSMIHLGQDLDDQVLELFEEDMQKEKFKTHVPLTSFESIRAMWVDKIKLKEIREFRMGDNISNQFPDDHKLGLHTELTNAAERYEAIYPRHRANDDVTFMMAVKKRLKFSNPQKESAKLRSAMAYGQVFLSEFLKRVPLDSRIDSTMMERSLHEFEDKKCSKSAATIENHSNRSCRDWLADVALLFMKSQLCTKYDNRFRDAKAGQTLACFQHSVLIRFAPYMRYIEKKLIAALPENYYVHSGKNFDELNLWVTTQNFGGYCTESDYEAFDSSQDEYIVAFEVFVMRYLQIPHDLIDDYVYIKTHLGAKLGNFSIMRFTGEASTFLFNTMANMLFTFMCYDLNGKESICFAGDDMCANKVLRRSSRFEGVLKRISLKAKVQFTSSPTFCGWCLSGFGIYKRPQLVFERLMIAVEGNNLHNCIDNYAIEVSYAYKLGEILNDLMTPEELENHYACVRFIVKKRNLMKSSAKDLYIGLD